MPFEGVVNPQKNSMFNNIIDQYLNQKQLNRQYQMEHPLKEAQAKKAMAEAQKADMIANLIKRASGENAPVNGGIQGEQPGQPRQPGQPVQQGQQGQQMPTGMNDQQKANEELIALGFLKETPAQQKKREIDTAFEKNLGASSIKQIDKWGDTILASENMVPILEHNQEILANPVMRDMYKHPELLNKDIQFLKKYGNEEQTELLNSFGTNVKSLYSSMASEFKGAFREFEKKLFDDAIPKDGDTLFQLQAKNNTLLALRKLMIERLTKADNIVRSSKGAISPNAALQIADKTIDAKKERDKIKKDFKMMVEEGQKNKERYKKTNKNEGMFTFGNKSEVAPKSKYKPEQIEKWKQELLESNIPQEKIDAAVNKLMAGQ